MILVDTSVWVEHFRAGSDRLRGLLLDEQVLCHPFVICELACGTLHKRVEILSMLKALPEAHLLEHREIMRFHRSAAFIRAGCGWVDVHLLASTLLTRCAIWTLDKPLRRAAATLNVLA